MAPFIIPEKYDLYTQRKEPQVKTASSSKVTKAIHVIKDQTCEKCGTQAKGFVYRKAIPIYYCRKCLRDEIDARGQQLVA